MSRHYGTWPREKVERLKLLAGQGMSATLIALDVSMTRNAVVGKCQRMKLALLGGAGRRSPKGATSKPIRKARDRMITVQRLPPVTPLGPLIREATAGLIPLIETREHHCRFMPGDARSLMCCGRQVAPKRPYCLDHARLCYSNVADPADAV